MRPGALPSFVTRRSLIDARKLKTAARDVGLAEAGGGPGMTGGLASGAGPR